MTSQAVDRRPLLPVTIDAKSHRVIDDALGDRHLREVAVAVRTVDIGADVGRMVEPHVRFSEESINPLPGNVFAALRVGPQRLDSWIGRVSDVFMTAHADIDARNSCPRARLHSRVTGVAEHSDVICMNLMREIDRLLRLWPDIAKLFGGIPERGVRCGESRRTPSLRRIWVGGQFRVPRPVGLLPSTKLARPYGQRPS